ncbi:MAG: protein-L-isoaspartate(D-aspartate) O-methyltransferase [Candidatus Izimaplasma sp.]|nr:protein-L-isoaspartate(D-aspartate) O-methyltransferase [Candidatus Izimaplasma bacterium]
MNNNYLDERKQMVKYQIENRGIRNPKLLDAFLKVPRHEFVEDNYIGFAYSDHPLGIGHNQTISQPYIVAYMIDKLAVKPEDKILEIGTGSGYQTAILAELAKEVYTIEVIKHLQENAINVLESLNYSNIHFSIRDGYEGWEEFAPYDKIIISAAPKEVPEELVNQLAIDGKMIVPIGGHFLQYLYLIEKKKNQTLKHKLDAVRFVPMVKK